MNSEQQNSNLEDQGADFQNFPENFGFGFDYICLVHELDALTMSTPPIIQVVSAQLFNASNKLKEFEERGELTISDKSYRFTGEYSRRILDLLQKQTKFSILNNNLPDFLLVYIIGRLENYVISLIKFSLINKPELIENLSNNLSLKEISEFKNIEDLKQKILDQQIENATNGNYFEKFSWFTSHQIDIKLIPFSAEIREAILRRNCAVHNSGKVNQRYLDGIKEIGIKSDLEIDDKLIFNSTYHNDVTKAMVNFCLFIFILTYEKILKFDKKFIHSTITETSYQIISSKRYDIACSMLKNVLKGQYKIADLETKANLVINYANAARLMGNQIEANKIINENNISWGALETRYKIAKEIVTGNFQKAASLLRTSNPYSKADFIQWPLFRGFRETPEFNEVYKEVFKEDFVNYELQVDKILIACGDFDINNITSMEVRIENLTSSDNEIEA